MIHNFNCETTQRSSYIYSGVTTTECTPVFFTLFFFGEVTQNSSRYYMCICMCVCVCVWNEYGPVEYHTSSWKMTFEIYKWFQWIYKLFQWWVDSKDIIQVYTTVWNDYGVDLCELYQVFGWGNNVDGGDFISIYICIYTYRKKCIHIHFYIYVYIYKYIQVFGWRDYVDGGDYWRCSSYECCRALSVRVCVCVFEYLYINMNIHR